MIYVFDPALNGINTDTMRIRAATTASPVAHLYKPFVEMYDPFDMATGKGSFKNYAFHQQSMADPGAGGTVVEIDGRVYPRIGIPTALLYNKDNVDQFGNWKPVMASNEMFIHYNTAIGGFSADYYEWNTYNFGQRTSYATMFGDFMTGKISFRFEPFTYNNPVH